MYTTGQNKSLKLRFQSPHTQKQKKTKKKKQSIGFTLQYKSRKNPNQSSTHKGVTYSVAINFPTWEYCSQNIMKITNKCVDVVKVEEK
jgi:hypothetical protein